MVNFKNIQDRQDYLSVDKLTAISSNGEILHVGDIVKHESEGDDLATIKSFKLDEENLEVIACTTKGEAHISFIYKYIPEVQEPLSKDSDIKRMDFIIDKFYPEPRTKGVLGK